MESNDIKLIRKALISLERNDLAELLRNSTSELDVSSTYGSRLFSSLSTYYVYCSPISYKAIIDLSKSDKDVIETAIYLIYPVRDNEPEIVEIKYLMNFASDQNELVEVNYLKNISFDYVKEQILKCDEKINNNDFEGAVTNARSLLESVCLFIYEHILGESFSYDGNLGKLHKKVADLIKMSPELYKEQNLKKIISGISSIVQGVAELRNSESDAHGKSPSKTGYRIDKRHALLVVNLAKTVSEYLYLSFEKYQKSNNAK